MRKDIAGLIIQQILFLDLSDDKTVDPDAACDQLEVIFCILRELPSKEIASFRKFVVEEAAERKKNKRPILEVETVRSICDDLDDTGE